MTLQLNGSVPIPGLEAVGRGIYVRPRQPYELKQLLFKQEKPRLCTLKDAEASYCVPEGYEVNDSPPMPSNQMLNQTTIEESWDRFDKQMNLDMNVAFGPSAFSINAGVGIASQMRSEEQAYYAVRSSFIPLWGVYLSDATAPLAALNQFEVPVPFKHAHRKSYEKFFQRFGSHYVKRAWVGGKASLFFTVSKSSNLSKEEVKAAIQASFGTAKGGVNAKQERTQENLKNSSQCSVSGRGGDELKLAALNSLDEAHYNEWLTTIRENPQTIELEVAGIWTLIDDPAKAEALNEAYREATAFTPITAAVGLDNEVHFLRGKSHVIYDIDRAEVLKPKRIVERWPELAKIGFDRIDAAFRGAGLTTAAGESLARKLFFFYRDQYVRIDADTNKIDPGFPKLIAEGWPGVTFERIDATLELRPDVVYFFSGNQYIRFNTAKDHADDGYPQPISKRWAGVTFDRIDAAIGWTDGKVYFFREDQHIRYDSVVYRSDPGYPKFIMGNYIEDWNFFD